MLQRILRNYIYNISNKIKGNTMYYDVTPYYKIEHSTAKDYKILLRTTENYKVLQTAKTYYRVLQSNTKCCIYKALQNTTKHNKVLQSQNTKMYFKKYKVPQDTTKYHSVLQGFKKHDKAQQSTTSAGLKSHHAAESHITQCKCQMEESQSQWHSGTQQKTEK